MPPTVGSDNLNTNQLHGLLVVDPCNTVTPLSSYVCNRGYTMKSPASLDCCEVVLTVVAGDHLLEFVFLLQSFQVCDSGQLP